MGDAVDIVQTTETHTAIVSLTVPRAEIVQAMDPGIRELVDALKAQGITPTGPWFTRHLRIDPAVFDFEISMPVATPVKPQGRVKPSVLPAVRAARTVYSGPYEGLGEAWGTFKKRIAAERHGAAPWLWEVYLVDPHANPDPASWRTRLNQPLLK